MQLPFDSDLSRSLVIKNTKMNKIIKSITLMLMILVMLGNTNKKQTNYCKGWEDGYCEGWKDVKGQLSICPVTPVCPVPKIECNEGYRCGYNRGFKMGYLKAKQDEI